MDQTQVKGKRLKQWKTKNIWVSSVCSLNSETMGNRLASLNVGLLPDLEGQKKGEYSLIGDAEDHQSGMFDKPLPCFGCGIGWFSLLIGFVCPFAWYFATVLYFMSYYRKDPRERSGLAASAIAALIFSVVAVITVLALLLSSR